MRLGLGDKLEFMPEYVYAVGSKTAAVVPLSVKYEVHQRSGWADRADKVKIALENSRGQARRS